MERALTQPSRDGAMPEMACFAARIQRPRFGLACCGDEPALSLRDSSSHTGRHPGLQCQSNFFVSKNPESVILRPKRNCKPVSGKQHGVCVDDMCFRGRYRAIPQNLEIGKSFLDSDPEETDMAFTYLSVYAQKMSC